MSVFTIGEIDAEELSGFSLDTAAQDAWVAGTVLTQDGYATWVGDGGEA
jgi:hypothetical protein